ncbi:hypothetical protein K4F52_003039 [Lecanicillium sp. MT-2017a]|nr:hypothetical protein K4F52_003039 [Lecanicillium sp. MT-2017a]
MTSTYNQELEVRTVQFGAEMQRQHFSFAQDYHPLNHGSFGASPKSVLEHQRKLQSQCEERPDTFIRYTYLDLLKSNRSAIAPLLGADAGEVVFVPNATTGVNTILRNLQFEENDVVLHFNTIYGACRKTIQSLAETCPVSSQEVQITYPISDEAIIDHFCRGVREVKASGKCPKLAMFDVVLTFPGVRFPWEKLVKVCKEHNILSFIDAAHGVGHVDMTHLGEVGPDFMISNCHKPKKERDFLGPKEYFSKLFDKVSTIDNTPYCCITQALQFRAQVCGGEANLAVKGGDRMAEIFGTEALDNKGCCFATVCLPLTALELGIGEGQGDDGTRAAKWMQELTPQEYNTYIPIKFYAGAFWCRISAQVYLGIEDFEWAARLLEVICERARNEEWR